MSPLQQEWTAKLKGATGEFLQNFHSVTGSSRTHAPSAELLVRVQFMVLQFVLKGVHGKVSRISPIAVGSGDVSEETRR